MLRRRDFAKAALGLAFVSERYARAVTGLPPLKIAGVKTIATGDWVFLKVLTSEPGLYGIGSASNAYEGAAVVAAIERRYKPFWIGKSADRIEDLWDSTNVLTYWRNSTIQNNILSALDMALWDIKGKRARMPVYDLLGGKVREAVPIYAHADGQNREQLADNIRKYMEEGYRHVRAQLGDYGGGGFITGPAGRPEHGYSGRAFDEDLYEDLYIDTIPKTFAFLRDKLGWQVKLLHDVHEHLSPTAAVELAKRFEPYNMFYVEDILPPEQIEWFRRIKQVSTTPMAMGELFVSPREYRPLISERVIDFIRCRVSQIGGITAARRIAALCTEFGVRTAWQEGGENDPVNQIAAYHVDLTIPSFGIQEENHFPPYVHEMLPGAAELRGGYLYGNDGPGLGIDVVEEIAAKYPPTPVRPGDGWTTVRGMDGSLVNP
jgi:mannonate dehydratase